VQFFGVNPTGFCSALVTATWRSPPSSGALKVQSAHRGLSRAGAQVHFYAVAPEDLEEIELPLFAMESMVAIEIRGSALAAGFNRWILYENTDQPATEEILGKLCVLGLHDGRIVVRHLQARDTVT
jgi:hypothetical protein